MSGKRDKAESAARVRSPRSARNVRTMARTKPAQRAFPVQGRIARWPSSATVSRGQAIPARHLGTIGAHPAARTPSAARLSDGNGLCRNSRRSVRTSPLARQSRPVPVRSHHARGAAALAAAAEGLPAVPVGIAAPVARLAHLPLVPWMLRTLPCRPRLDGRFHDVAAPWEPSRPSARNDARRGRSLLRETPLLLQ